MKRSKTLKRIWSLLLTLAMVLTMGITAMPSYAAGSGTAEVYYPPAESADFPQTTFSLYKVGHFARYTEADEEAGLIPKGYEAGDSYLALDAGIPDVGAEGGKVDVLIRKDTYADEDGNVDETPEGEWVKAWQTSAANLASVIGDTGVTPVTAKTSAPSGKAIFTGLEDGLYLLIGPQQEVMDKDKGENTYYTPSPSFIMVLNGTAKLQVKFEEKTVKEYVIKKAWNDAGYDALRPTSINIELYRRDSSQQYSSEEEGWEKFKTVTFPAKVSEEYPTPWSYKWPSEPKYQWKWKEVLGDDAIIHYIVTETKRMGQAVGEDGEEINDDNIQYVTLTNTYTKRQLELTKILEQFLENGDNSATFVFEIRGFIGQGENERQVYTGSAGINFAKDSTGTLTKLVDNIPVNLTRLEVEEIYASNYEAVSDVEGESGKVKNAVLVDRGPDEPPIYTVSFKNKFNDDITIKGGIVNKYTNEEGKIVLTDKDYGKIPPGGQEQ